MDIEPKNIQTYQVKTYECDWEHFKKALVEEWHDGTGRLHRLGGEPAVKVRDRETGLPICLKYFEHGRLHRLDGPADVRFRPPYIQPTIEEYYQLGVLHRDDGPAKIWYDPEREHLLATEYYRRGKRSQSFSNKLC